MARVLLTGATGFVGRHVAGVLATHGHDVLGATRHPESAHHDADLRFCHVDLDDVPSIEAALAQVDRAVYLVHAMGSSSAFADLEHRYAEHFRAAAEKRRLERIVYLGGMRPRGPVSRHLASRLRTGEILRASVVPVVELQATMIVGGGSASFRIVRDLAARLPGMVLPKWLRNLSEPVAIGDIAEAIAHALTMPLERSVVLAAPGPEALSGREMILRTAHAMGHAPVVADVPLVTPRLSSYWIRLVTRANPEVATELVEGLRSNILATGPTIWERMPGYRRTPFDQAVHAALSEETDTLPPAARTMENFLHHLTPAG